MIGLLPVTFGCCLGHIDTEPALHRGESVNLDRFGRMRRLYRRGAGGRGGKQPGSGLIKVHPGVGTAGHVTQPDHRHGNIAACSLTARGNYPKDITGGGAAILEMNGKMELIAPFEGQDADHNIGRADDGRAGRTAAIAAQNGGCLGAHIGAPVEQIGDFVHGPIFQFILGDGPAEPAVGGTESELGSAGCDRRNRGRGRRNEVADGQPRPAGPDQGIATDLHAPDGRVKLHRRPGRHGNPPDAVQSRNTDGVHLRNRRIGLDFVRDHLFRRRHNPGTHMQPRNLLVIGFSHAEYLGILTFPQVTLAGRLGNTFEDFFFRELNQTICILTVNPHGSQKFDSGMEKIVRRLIIAGNGVFPVILDAVLPDQFFDLGHEDLHVKVLFAHDRSIDRLFTDIQKIRHTFSLLYHVFCQALYPDRTFFQPQTVLAAMRLPERRLPPARRKAEQTRPVPADPLPVPVFYMASPIPVISSQTRS